MLIKSIKISKKVIIFSLVAILLLSSIIIFYSFASEIKEEKQEEKKNFIKWVDFNVSSEALSLTAKLDIDSHIKDEDTVYNWIELLAYLACKNGGNFKNFKANHLNSLVEELKNGHTINDLTRRYEIL